MKHVLYFRVHFGGTVHLPHGHKLRTSIDMFVFENFHASQRGLRGNAKAIIGHRKSYRGRDEKGTPVKRAARMLPQGSR